MAVSGLTVLFSEAERPRAVGVWAAANFLALPLGPILGGWVLTHYWWGWVFGWERRLGRRPDGRPLLDPALLRSRSFTWGMLLMTTATMALVGVLFTMPQYFQGILGTDAMGSGLRFLPMMAGLAVGAIPADQMAARVGARNTVALGFAVLAAGLLAGAMTRAGSGEGFLAAWLAAAGAGVGLAMTTAITAALGELPAERSGVGSAVLQAVKNVGTPLGAAVFGSVLSSGYQARLHLEGLPRAAAAAVQTGLFGGLTVAVPGPDPAARRSSGV